MNCGVPQDVVLRQPANLSFANHVHRFGTLNRSPRAVERAEALHGSNASFDRSMALLHNIIQIANGSTAAALTEFPGLLHILDGLRVSGILIYIDNSRPRMVL